MVVVVKVRVVVVFLSFDGRSQEDAHDGLGVLVGVDGEFVAEWFVVEVVLPGLEAEGFSLLVALDVDGVVDEVFALVEVGHEFVYFNTLESDTVEF